MNIYIYFLFSFFQLSVIMDSDLSSQDQRDLDKFIKFFALKVRLLWLRSFLWYKSSRKSVRQKLVVMFS